MTSGWKHHLASLYAWLSHFELLYGAVKISIPAPHNQGYMSSRAEACFEDTAHVKPSALGPACVTGLVFLAVVTVSKCPLFYDLYPSVLFECVSTWGQSCHLHVTFIAMFHLYGIKLS